MLLPGILYFCCEECKQEWREASRDVGSPSGYHCYCGLPVSGVDATTTQFDNLKHKLTPCGVTPVGIVNNRIKELEAKVDQLVDELEDLNRDALYCPSCACNSCYEESEKRKREDTW